jgi:hypothetical protein
MSVVIKSAINTILNFSQLRSGRPSHLATRLSPWR